jgi:hypothetical protein
MNNYRKISLISILNKLLEKLMHRRLVNYMTEKNILYPKQFGFRSNYSTDHAILCITDTIQRSIITKNTHVEFFWISVRLSNLVPRAFPFLSLGRREKAQAPGVLLCILIGQ